MKSVLHPLITAVNCSDLQRDILPHDAADLEDKEDEQPVVVVLKPGDVTAEEAANIKKEGKMNLTLVISFSGLGITMFCLLAVL
jgi:hypothetical protein